MLAKRWSMVPSSLSSSAEDQTKKRRGRILRKRKKQGNGTVDRVQELLQKTHAAFLNRNFVQGKTSQAGDYYNPFCNI
uniref:Uncharacterized protein n=1 Tax=Triticum urartu TaxID=4572 RepID=A0A8R7V310_TRIUA